MKVVVFLSLCAAPAFADSTLPDPPVAQGTWVTRCVERLERARAEAAEREPAFSTGEIVVENKPPGVRFDAKLPDAEHARFFPKKPAAHYTLRVIEKKSKQAGALGGDVGKASDSQASLSFDQWTTRRAGTMEVQIAGGRTVHLFGRVFKAALEDCLR